MSLDTSLKTVGNLATHRNVLKRHERIGRLKDKGAFDPKRDTALHLPKVGNRKPAVGKKKAPKTEEE